MDVDQDVTDEELTALALAADPDPDLDGDAVPIRGLDEGGGDLLPSWYMPAPMAGAGGRRWMRWVVLLIVASFVAIDAYGLCSTYGHVGFG